MTEEDLKRKIAERINGVRLFVLKYRSNKRLVEANFQGFLKEFETRLAKAKDELDRAQKLYDEAQEKLSAKQEETNKITVWLVENKDRFEQLEEMLSDESAKLAEQLMKCVS